MRINIKCPSCGTDAKDRTPIAPPDIWDDPYCPSCDKSLTVEGLILEEANDSGISTVREVGKGGAVIWEYPAREATGGRPSQTEAKRFLLRILRLEKEISTKPVKTVPIAEANAKWNRKAACRRFRQWFRYEYAGRPLEIREPTLRELAVKLLTDESASVPIPPVRDDIDNEESYFQQKYYRYQDRMLVERPLIVSHLPPASRLMLIEAQDAYRFGLFRAVLAICRALLEDVVKHIPNKAAEPIRPDGLANLLSCLPASIISPADRELAFKVKNRGDDAMHKADFEPDESEAARDLSDTSALIQRLTENDDLR